MRRIATERPATDEVVVRVIMGSITGSFWPARSAGALCAHAARRPWLVRSSDGSVSGAGAD
jgi:hypothetical protein